VNTPLPQSLSKLGWKAVPAIWWSVVWRTALYAGFPVGFLSVVLARFLYGWNSPDYMDAQAGYQFVFQIVLGIPLSMLALKFGLEKHLPILREEGSDQNGQQTGAALPNRDH